MRLSLRRQVCCVICVLTAAMSVAALAAARDSARGGADAGHGALRWAATLRHRSRHGSAKVDSISLRGPRTIGFRTFADFTVAGFARGSGKQVIVWEVYGAGRCATAAKVESRRSQIERLLRMTASRSHRFSRRARFFALNPGTHAICGYLVNRRTRATVAHASRLELTATVTSTGAPAATSPTHVTSSPTPVLTAPVNVVAPQVAGTAQVGQTLTAAPGTWTEGPTFAYAWQECNANGVDCSGLGVTTSSYQLPPTAAGSTIRIVVTASNAAGHATITSAPSAVVIGAQNAYVANSAAGTADGSSCANAHSAGWFNASGDWGSGSGQIGPGTMVHLCGPIAQSLTAHGSGTNGDPVTVYFEPGAAISVPVCPGSGSGCFDTNNQSYLTLDGGQDGKIASTANGTDLANQQSSVLGVEAVNCTGCTIEDLDVSDMYVIAGDSDSAPGSGTGPNGIEYSGSGVTIADNTLHDDFWAIVAEQGNHDADVSVEGNDIYNIDHGIALKADGTSGGSVGPISVFDNDIHDFAKWDTSGDYYHHDGIHCFTADAGAALHYNGLYIYDNTFGGDTGSNMTAQIFLEGPEGGTPCQDSTSNVWIFNNVLSSTAELNCGIACLNPPNNFVNNTVVGPDNRGGACITDGGNVSENNVATTCGTLHSDGDSSLAAVPFLTLDYNVYANGGGSALVYGDNYLALLTGLVHWRSLTGGDAHSAGLSSADLGSTGAPQSGSPVIGAGKNLTSLCTGYLAPLCSEIDGTPRPATGAWDAGAY